MSLSDVLYQLPHLHERIARARAELDAAERALDQALAPLPAHQALALRGVLLEAAPRLIGAGTGEPLPVSIAPPAHAVLKTAPEREPAPLCDEPVQGPELGPPWDEPVPEPPEAPAPPVQEPAAAEDAPLPPAEREEDGRVSVHAYARSLGSMPGPIGKLINNGVIKPPAITKARRIDPDLADRQLARAKFQKASAIQARAKARIGLSATEQAAVDQAIAAGKLVKDPGPARFEGGMRFGQNSAALIETGL